MSPTMFEPDARSSISTMNVEQPWASSMLTAGRSPLDAITTGHLHLDTLSCGDQLTAEHLNRPKE